MSENVRQTHPSHSSPWARPSVNMVGPSSPHHRAWSSASRSPKKVDMGVLLDGRKVSEGKDDAGMSLWEECQYKNSEVMDYSGISI